MESVLQAIVIKLPIFQGKLLKKFIIYRFSLRLCDESLTILLKRTSPSPLPLFTDSIHTRGALATVEAFFQASNCSEHTIICMAVLEEGTTPAKFYLEHPNHIGPRQEAVRKAKAAHFKQAVADAASGRKGIWPLAN